MLIKSVRGFTPKYGIDCFFAENSSIIGEVIMGDNCSVWYQAVIRGDVNFIEIGNRVNIQDGAIIHGTYEQSGTKIGNDVSIGHNAIIHGCTIKDSVLIGMGSIIMDNSVVESKSIIAAGSVLPKKTIVPEGSVFAGVPAKKIKEIDPGLQKGEIDRIAKNYLTYASWFK
jgi:carbonic anhydrase/acetyltransferase-like protein (isoleucine patch superfamily)